MNSFPNGKPSTDIRVSLKLRPVINVSGTMTALGASIVGPEAIAAMTAILPEFVEIDDLQKKASAVIARLCGAEAGFVTASCSAGITLAIAGAMTGADLAAVERLPDTTGLKNEVVVMMGHMVGYGAPVDQAIRLLEGKLEVKVASRKFDIIDGKNVNTYDRTTLLAPNDFKPQFKLDPAKK